MIAHDPPPPAAAYYVMERLLQPRYFTTPPERDALQVKVTGPDGRVTWWLLNRATTNAVVRTLMQTHEADVQVIGAVA
jgi:hypothetical protein